MNIEELKLILDTINTIAGGANDLALVWIVMHYALQFLTLPLALAIVGTAIYVIARLILTHLEWSKAGRQVAEAWGASHAHYGIMSANDRVAITRALVAAKEASK